MKQFEINVDNEGQRFDKYLARILSSAKMSFIYKMLRKKNFVLNDKKATGKEIIKKGDIVKLYISDETYNKFKTDTSKDNYFKIPLGIDFNKLIIYEDKDILLINKPKGMLSQKADKNGFSVNEYVLNYLYLKDELSDKKLINFKPSVINRLDRNTTGIIIAAKNLKTSQVLSKALKDREINKFYKCIVYGSFNKNGIYTAYITKDNNKNTVVVSDKKTDEKCEEIKTEYELIDISEGLSTVRVHLITGKSHQIRAHIAHIGFPIIGDYKYGNKTVNGKYKAKSQLLHAYRIEFPIFDKSFGFEFSGKVFECEPEFKY